MRCGKTHRIPARAANITIGDSILQISQPNSPFIYLPFHENFSAPPVAFFPETVDLNSTNEPRSRWVLLDQAGATSKIMVSPDGPDGTNALLVERPVADKENWKTQIYLPRIKIKEGGQYAVSLRVKAENPALVWLAFIQASPPYQSCGLAQAMQAGQTWKKYTLQFRAGQQNCGADNNWLVIQAGLIHGKLWIADVSLTEAR